MSTILPLPLGIAHGLPWRMTFPSGRDSANLDRFSDPEFVASLSPGDRKYSEKVIHEHLAKMLEARHIPRRIGRLRTNKEVSLKVLEARPATSLHVTLGTDRFTILESAGWIGLSVANLLKAAEPDPGMPARRSSLQFHADEYESIGQDEAMPAAAQLPPVRRRVVYDRKLTLNLEPRVVAGLHAGDASLRVRAANGLIVTGNDLRLGWMLAEANKVCPLDGGHILGIDEVLASLADSWVPNASDLGLLLKRRLTELEQASVPQEIREILSAMFAAVKKPEPWTEESLHWAFGVSQKATPAFDESFWGSDAAAQKTAVVLRRRLQPLAGLMATRSVYSPALQTLRKSIEGIRFMGAWHLQTRLAPLIGKAHVIGIMHFLTDMLDLRDGAMVSTLINGGTARATDLFFWVPHSRDALWAHVVCMRARDLSVAQGAFSLAAVLKGAKAELGSRSSGLSVLKTKDCEDILNELPTVRWLLSEGWGVVQDATLLPPLIETMLAVTHPRALKMDDARKSLEWVLSGSVEFQSARNRLGVKSLASSQILIQALINQDVRGNAAAETLALKLSPPPSFWKARPLEALIIETLRAAGGSMLNRLLYSRLREHKAYDSLAIVNISKSLPYLWAPTSLSTALRDWAL